MRAGAFEPVLNGVFAAVSEGRISEVVAEGGGVDDFAEVGWVEAVVAEVVALADGRADAGAEAAPDAGDFEGMGEAGARKVVFCEGEDLRFILQTAEGAGENDAVAVALKVGASGFAAARFGAPKSVCAE